MKRDIFHSAALRLASTYLLVIMTISLVFSFWLYNVSVSEIRSSVLRAPGPVEQVLRRENRRFAMELESIQEQAVNDARRNLLYQFIVLNSFIALGGGLFSYYLARRHLQPIKEAHDSLMRFTADASHELRTPITAMQLETEVTLQDPRLTLKQAKKQLESNLDELQKLTSLSEKLLNLARLDAQERVQKEPTHIPTLIKEAVSFVHPQLQKKRQRIQIESEDVTVPLQADLIREAIIILLDNASKYSQDNTTISVQSSIKNKFLEVRLQDHGIGIAKKDLPHIFERFYRADHSRSKNQVIGHGVGLSLAQSSIRAHGGNIFVISKPGSGSTFTIQLPLS